MALSTADFWSSARSAISFACPSLSASRRRSSSNARRSRPLCVICWRASPLSRPPAINCACRRRAASTCRSYRALARASSSFLFRRSSAAPPIASRSGTASGLPGTGMIPPHFTSIWPRSFSATSRASCAAATVAARPLSRRSRSKRMASRARLSFSASMASARRFSVSAIFSLSFRRLSATSLAAFSSASQRASSLSAPSCASPPPTSAQAETPMSSSRCACGSAIPVACADCTLPQTEFEI